MLCGFLPVTLHLQRARAVESEGSMVIIILLLLHSSSDGPHPSAAPPSRTPPSLFPHIPVFIGFPSPPDFVSPESRHEQRNRNRQKHREIDRAQEMTRRRWKRHWTEERRQKKEEGSVLLFHLEASGNLWPFSYAHINKVPLVRRHQVKIWHSLCAAHPISLPHPSLSVLIPLSQSSLSLLSSILWVSYSVQSSLDIFFNECRDSVFYFTTHPNSFPHISRIQTPLPPVLALSLMCLVLHSGPPFPIIVPPFTFCPLRP